MAEELQLPSDRQLVDATRAGSASAWLELRGRHERVVAAVASATRSRAWLDDVFERLQHDLVDGPAADDLAAGVRAIRPRAISILTGGTYAPYPPGATEEAAPDVADPRSGGLTAAELSMLATAFGSLSERWQTVLWHELVDLEPAATTSAVLGRSAADTVALASIAEAGLFDSFAAVELEADGAVNAECRPVVSLLGAYRRGTLPDAQHRVVDAHLDATECAACRRRLGLADQLGGALPAAIVPGLTGLTPERYRMAIGAAVAVIGASALAAQRSARANRWARIGAVAAIVIALLAAAVLIRSPFDDLDGEIADLLAQSSTTTTTPGSSPSTSDPSGPEALPSRIELVFPGVPQGIVYVPGGPSQNLALSLSTPAPVFRNGTGTIDAAITNNADAAVTSRFIVRPSPGVSFDAVTGGTGRCERSGDVGAVCVVDIDAGDVASLSLRFALDETVARRLVVVSSIRSGALDLPIETVPGLAIGTVSRGRLITVGDTLGSCMPGVAECPAAGERSASSVELDLPPGAEIDSALLLWRGDAASPGWASQVGLVVPGQSAAATVDRTAQTEAGDAGFESSADVTDLLRGADAGRYTVVRAPSRDDPGDGSWTLVVVTRESEGPRRLIVAVGPRQVATRAVPVGVDVPVVSPAPPGPPRLPIRPLIVQVVVPSGSTGVLVSVDGAEMAPPGGPATDRLTYDLDIDAEASSIEVLVATSARPLPVATIGLAVDIVT